jgi:hypothetical protein
MPATSPLRRLGQKGHEFKTCLGYIMRHCLKNKSKTVFVSNGKIAFKQKLEFWNISSCHNEHTKFPKLNDFLDEVSSDTNSCCFDTA